MEPVAVESTPEGPVDRAFHVLQVVVAAGEPIGVREVGRRTGLPRSSASRLIATLERLRMVARTADGGVEPGPGLATLRTDVSTRQLIAEQLRPVLADLVQRYDEHAAIAIDDGDALLYVAQVAADQPVSVGDVIGERHAFHLVAPGLVAMAWWDDARLERYLSTDLIAATTSSVVAPSQLRARIQHTRDQGWAWTDQELDLGINGIGWPVVVDGELVATVSLYGPSYRFSPASQPDLGAQVAELLRDRSATLAT